MQADQSKPNPQNELEDARGARAAQIIADLEGLRSPRCADCGGELCAHEAVISWSMGFLGSTYCCSCLAGGLGQTNEELLVSAHAFVDALECWRAGWEWASEKEGDGCALSARLSATSTGGDAAPLAEESAAESAEEHAAADATWDAGDMACGELLLQLRGTLGAMAPDAVLHLVSLDPASPEDLPAWCKLTRHALVSHRHPDYWIRRRPAP